MTLRTLSLPWRSLPYTRTPLWGTIYVESLAGVGVAQQVWTYPRYRYQIASGPLRGAAAYAELQTLLGFYNLVAGRAQIFRFQDPLDGSVTNQLIGTGDGVTLGFQLLREFGGFVEPVFAPNVANIYLNKDWQGNQLQYATTRTNYAAYSNEFENPAPWTQFQSSASNPGTILSPDGTNDARRWQRNGVNLNGWIQNGFFVGTSAPGPFTMSVWAKPGTGNFLAFDVSDGASNGVHIVANVATGVITSTSAFGTGFSVVSSAIQSYSNGWYRVGLTFNKNTTTSLLFVVSGNTNGATAAASDAINTTTLNLFGSQLEAGTAMSTYIANVGNVQNSVTDLVSISDKGVVTFTTAPPIGASITWTGTFFWYCRFDQDIQDFEQLVSANAGDPWGPIWDAKSLSFSTVKFGA